MKEFRVITSRGPMRIAAATPAHAKHLAEKDGHTVVVVAIPGTNVGQPFRVIPGTLNGNWEGKTGYCTEDYSLLLEEKPIALQVNFGYAVLTRRFYLKDLEQVKE